MEMGPVLVVTFQAQQIAYIADATGKVIEGDPVCDNHLFKYFLSRFFLFLLRNKLIELIIYLHLAVIQLFLIL
jgi:hypothetical protein